MKQKQVLLKLSIVAVLGSLLLSACGGGSSAATATPTLSIVAIQTWAVSTFAAALTQTSIAMPTDTVTSTVTTTSTPTRIPTTILAVPTSSCYGLTGVADVTIPDNTPMVAGQTFIKTWKVKNTGTCPWSVGFRFAFTSGDAMSGLSVVLNAAVAPGATVDLSVPMIAPAGKTGAVRGNWRMSTAAGAFFGDEEFVIIVLGGPTSTAPTSTNTGAAATGTPTSTPTASATPTNATTP